MTGFSPKVRRLIVERSAGRCEIQVRCEGAVGRQLHHRRPRGIGGASLDWVNEAANGLMACLDCHAWVESNRAAATRKGLLVSLFTQYPAAYVPLIYRGRSVMLDDLGGIGECEAAS